MSQAVIGKGTFIQYSTGSEDFIVLAEVIACSQPKITIGKVEATHYLSPDNAIEKKSAEWIDVDDIPLTFQMTAAQYEDLNSLAGVEGVNWEIVIPKLLKKHAFTGFISSLGGGEIPLKDIIKTPVTITPEGLVEFSTYTP